MEELDRSVFGERGQVMPLVVAVMAVLVVVLLGVARLGAAGGRSAAVSIAVQNGARVVAFRVVGTDAIVTVVVRHVRASARAHADPPASG
ncbi:MAG: hypothetical protein M3Z46_02370 [Actinomycetota bacterium]|nr:hypothetical protein [Actinomycetota bacterium]